MTVMWLKVLAKKELLYTSVIYFAQVKIDELAGSTDE